MVSNKEFDAVRDSIELVNKMIAESARAEAFAKDKEVGKDAFYIDEDDGTFCIFGTESGFCYGQYYDGDSAEDALAEIKSSISEDVLLPKEEVLHSEDESIESSDEELEEDYDHHAQYGSSVDEVVATLAKKYLGVDQGDVVGEVVVNTESLFTALRDAFAAGQDLHSGSCKVCDSPEYIENSTSSEDKKIEVEVEIKERTDEEGNLLESYVNGKAKMSDGSVWNFSVSDETGEIKISTVFKDVPANATVISESAFNVLQDILHGEKYEDLSTEEKLAELEQFKTEIAIAVRDFFGHSSIQQHISENVSQTLEAYSGSLGVHVDDVLSNRD